MLQKISPYRLQHTRYFFDAQFLQLVLYIAEIKRRVPEEKLVRVVRIALTDISRPFDADFECWREEYLVVDDLS